MHILHASGTNLTVSGQGLDDVGCHDLFVARHNQFMSWSLFTQKVRHIPFSLFQCLLETIYG